VSSDATFNLHGQSGVEIKGYNEDASELFKEVTRLLYIAGSAKDEVAIQLSIYASLMFDDIMARVGLRDHASGIAELTGAPLASAADIVDCLGDQRVASLLDAAARALEGDDMDGLEKDLELFADCAGWLVMPDKMVSDEQRGAAVMVSFAAAINKWLEELAGRVSEP
jgi:hypothetical protein